MMMLLKWKQHIGKKTQTTQLLWLEVIQYLQSRDDFFFPLFVWIKTNASLWLGRLKCRVTEMFTALVVAQSSWNVMLHQSASCTQEKKKNCSIKQKQMLMFLYKCVKYYIHSHVHAVRFLLHSYEQSVWRSNLRMTFNWAFNFTLLGILTSKLPCGYYGNNQHHQHHWHHDGS